MLCYRMDKDFTQEGEVKEDANAQAFRLSMEDIDKWVMFPPDSFASLKGFALKHKERCEKLGGGK